MAASNKTGFQLSEYLAQTCQNVLHRLHDTFVPVFTFLAMFLVFLLIQGVLT